MLTDTSRWSHARGNEVVPYRWQATDLFDRSLEKIVSVSAGVVSAAFTAASVRQPGDGRDSC